MSETTAPSPRPPRGLLDRLIAPLDNVWLGIGLLAVLFVLSRGVYVYAYLNDWGNGRSVVWIVGSALPGVGSPS